MAMVSINFKFWLLLEWTGFERSWASTASEEWRGLWRLMDMVSVQLPFCGRKELLLPTEDEVGDAVGWLQGGTSCPSLNNYEAC